MKLVLLSPEAVAQLAEPYGVDANELYRKTAGNPFFVVEALAAGSGRDSGHGQGSSARTRRTPQPAARTASSRRSPSCRRRRSSGSWRRSPARQSTVSTSA